MYGERSIKEIKRNVIGKLENSLSDDRKVK